MTAPRIQKLEPFGPGGTAAATSLALWPEIPASALAAGKPVQRGHYYLEDKARGLTAGVWDCTAMTEKGGPYSVNEFMILLEGEVTIIEAPKNVPSPPARSRSDRRDAGEGGAPSGRAGEGAAQAEPRRTTFRAGESFIIPKGLPCQWHQDGYVRKFFVIFDDASGMVPPDPAALAPLRPDPRADLAPSAGPAPELLLRGAPQQRDKRYYADLTGQWTVGVWSSTPYHRKTIPFPRHELMHILEGEVTITEEGQPPRTFKAGDTFVVPMGTLCDWKSTVDIRKFYCIMQPKAEAAGVKAAE
ncbi:MAG: cupin domain-containing protein [Aestuariivirga sp.]